MSFNPYRNTLKLTSALLLILLLTPPALAETWTIDPPHSAAHFSIRHMMIAQVRGMFPDVTGTIDFDGTTPTAFDVSIGVESLDTGVADRDTHLKSKDFFEVETYPVMTFKSTRVIPSGGGYRISGTMTIKGVKRDVTLTLMGLDETRTDPWNNVRRGGTASFKLDRRDYKINWNAPLDGGGLMIGNEVEVIVDLEAIRP